MSHVARRIATAVMLPIVVFAVAIGTANPAAASTAAKHETQVVKLVNQERAKKGCKALKVNTALRKAARAHSKDMAKHSRMSHAGSNGSTFTQRAKRAGYKHQAVGENVAWGYSTPKKVMGVWMKSSGHKKNILKCSTKSIGVGVAYRTDGTPYWTQVFGAR